MATWKDTGQSNFKAAVDLYDGGHYRSAASRFYYAVFALITGELLQRNASSDFAGGRGTPGHAQMTGLVEKHFTQFSLERMGNFTQLLRNLYAARIAADYSLQRVDRQSARDSYTAARKIADYLEGGT